MRGRRYHGQSEDLKVQYTCAVLLPMLKSALNLFLFLLTKPRDCTLCVIVLDISCKLHEDCRLMYVICWNFVVQK